MVLGQESVHIVKEYFEQIRQSKYFANARNVGILSSKIRFFIYQSLTGEEKGEDGMIYIHDEQIQKVIEEIKLQQ